MTVKEVLDSYYGLLYQAEGEWISGENADVDGVTVVQVEYSSELLEQLPFNSPCWMNNASKSPI